MIFIRTKYSSTLLTAKCFLSCKSIPDKSEEVCRDMTEFHKVRNMIVYIAGPMTNRPHFYRPAFNSASERLIVVVDIPHNPVLPSDGLSLADYTTICMSMLKRADGIHLLDGREGNRGQLRNYHLAYKLQVKVMNTYACWMLSAGANPAFIAGQLDPENAEMTYKVYSA